MKTIHSLFFLALPLLVNAQLSKDPGDFSKLTVSGNVHVLLQKGNDPQIEIQGAEVDVDKVSVKNTNGHLRIRLVDRMFQDRHATYIVLTYTELEFGGAHAGAQIESMEQIVAGALKLRATSGARVDLELKVESLELVASEGGQLRLRGIARHQEAQITTGGMYRGYDLKSMTAVVKAGAGGRAKVFAAEKLEASAHTGGHISYKGDPGLLDRKTTLAGQVNEGW